VSLACPEVWGFPHIEHLIYLLLLDKGDGGVDTEESKDACQTIMDIHIAMPVVICVVLDKV
jgi:hypothetical protein